MTLSRDQAEKELVKRGAVTKKKIQQMAALSGTGYGRNKQWMTKFFLEEVKNDFSAFFPSEPDHRFMKANATKLFRYGGNAENINYT